MCSSCFSKLSNIVEKSKQLVVNSLFQNCTSFQTKQHALDFLHFRFTFLVVFFFFCNNEPSALSATQRAMLRSSLLSADCNSIFLPRFSHENLPNLYFLNRFPSMFYSHCPLSACTHFFTDTCYLYTYFWQKQDSSLSFNFTVECVCVCIVCRVCVWVFLNKLNHRYQKAHDEDKTSRILSVPWDTGTIPQSEDPFKCFFFFSRKPMGRLAGNFAELGTFERPPGGNTHTMLLANRQTWHLFELQLEEN